MDEDVTGKDQQPCGEEDEPEITGEVTGSTSASAPAAGSEAGSRKQGKLGGRPADPIRQFFESTGDVDKSQRRPPCKCKRCKKAFTASQADSQNLKLHIANCKDATPQERLEAQQMLAKQTNSTAAATAAAAAAAGGVKRKAVTQLSMEHYTGGSHNALLPDQLRVAAQHLTRAIVSNNLPFKVPIKTA